MTDAFVYADELEDGTIEPAVMVTAEDGTQASIRLTDFLLIHALEESDAEAYATVIELAQLLVDRLPQGGLTA